MQDHRHEQEEISVVDAVMGQGKNQALRVLLYCCADDSLLAQWFLNHKQEALRLTLPDYDMSPKHNGRLVAEALRERARRHHRSLVCVALTCTPWCAWQNYNLRVCDGATVEQIKKARVESEEMINILYDLVKSMLDDTDVEPYVHFAFEWPRWCRGWGLEIVNKLRSYFAYVHGGIRWLPLRIAGHLRRPAAKAVARRHDAQVLGGCLGWPLHWSA